MGLSNKDKKIIAKMKQSAKKSKLNSKHCCCLVQKSSKILTTAVNTSRSKVGANNYACCHAEHNALHQLKNFYRCKVKKRNKFRKITLYVIRINSEGTLTNSAPCASCAQLIRKVGIKKIVYSNAMGGVTKVKTQCYTTSHISAGFILCSHGRPGTINHSLRLKYFI